MGSISGFGTDLSLPDSDGGYGITSVIPFTDISMSNAITVIANALVNIDANNLVESAGVVTELPSTGTGGSDYDLDVVLGTGANGKPHESGSVVLFGAAGDYLSTPDSAGISVTGDIDLRWGEYVEDATPTATQSHISKADTNRSYFTEVRNDGKLRLFTSPDGTGGNQVSGTSTIARTRTGLSYYRITLDVDDGSGNRVYKFYESATEAGLTDEANLLGTAVTEVGTTSIYDGTEDLNVGAFNDSVQGVTGRMVMAKVYNGIDGTLVASMDPRDQTNEDNGDTSTFTTSATSEVWTQNGNCFIQNTGNKVAHSIGSYGLENTSGQAISIPMTVKIVCRPTDLSALAFVLSARSTSGSALDVGVNSTPAYRVNAGATQLVSSADQEWRVVTIQHNGDSTSKFTIRGVGSTTGDIGSESWDFGTLFTWFDATSHFSGAVGCLLAWDSALSEVDSVSVDNFLSAKYGGI